MLRLAKIALLVTIPLAGWGLVAMGPRGALMIGGLVFGVSFMLLIVIREAWSECFGGGKPEPRPLPDEVLQEVATMREPGSPRFAFWLQVAHLPRGGRQSVRLRLWDEPDWRGTVQVHEALRDRGDMVREGAVQPVDVAGLREVLEKYGAKSLKCEPFRCFDGSPASLYIVEQGVEAIPSGSMNLFRVPGDPIFDPATYAFFMAVLRAAGL